MNCSKLFLISITTALCALFSHQTYSSIKTTVQIEQEIDQWLLNYYAQKSFSQEIIYCQDLYNKIKKHLLYHNYIQHTPHKELKSIVKTRVKILHARQHFTEKWIHKHKKQIIKTINFYINKHPQAKPQHIITYINTCHNKTCKQLQEALQDPEILSELIKQTIKKIIKNIHKTKHAVVANNTLLLHKNA